MKVGPAGAVLIATLSLTDSAAAETAHYGAVGPDALDIVIRGSVGMAMILPHFVASGRLGLGGGVYGELGYGNLAAFGQQARARLGWGINIAGNVDLGVAARTAYSTLQLADEGIVGIRFSSLPIGNDWEVGNDIVLTWNRPDQAHITLSVGPTFTLGGTRFFAFNESEFEFDPSARSIDVGIQGEWGVWETANVFVRLDAQFLLGIEEDEACVQAQQDDCGQLVPFGFIPIGAVGVAWAI